MLITQLQNSSGAPNRRKIWAQFRPPIFTRRLPWRSRLRTG